jgi:hypothetical protein
VILRLLTCGDPPNVVANSRAGELKFKDKRDIVAHLIELASAGKITYTVIITGTLTPPGAELTCEVSSWITRCPTRSQESISTRRKLPSQEQETNPSRLSPEMILVVTLWLF